MRELKKNEKTHSSYVSRNILKFAVQYSLADDNYSAKPEILYRWNSQLIIVFTKACHWALSYQLNAIHNLTIDFLIIHFNIILSCISKSPLNSSNQNVFKGLFLSFNFLNFNRI
jgi:hypothetical protein